jgi:hypothetical protein
VDAAVGGWAGEQLAAPQARAAHTPGGALVPVNAGRRVLALDGKTLRGSAPRSTPEQVAIARADTGRTHLVAFCDHTNGVSLGHAACSREAGKSGEVAAAQAR